MKSKKVRISLLAAVCLVLLIASLAVYAKVQDNRKKDAWQCTTGTGDGFVAPKGQPYTICP